MSTVSMILMNKVTSTIALCHSNEHSPDCAHLERDCVCYYVTPAKNGGCNEVFDYLQGEDALQAIDQYFVVELEYLVENDGSFPLQQPTDRSQ